MATAPSTKTDHDDIAKLEDLAERARDLNVRAKADLAREQDKGELIAFVAFIGIGFAAVGGAIWAGIRDERKMEARRLAREAKAQKLRDDLDNWINEQEAAGNNVYALKDNRYLAVDRAARQIVQIKRTS